MGMPALPESMQGMRLALGAGRGDCGDGKRDGGEQKTSAETHGQVEDEDNDEHVALRWRKVQEGVYDDGGGRGR